MVSYIQGSLELHICEDAGIMITTVSEKDVASEETDTKLAAIGYKAELSRLSFAIMIVSAGESVNRKIKII